MVNERCEQDRDKYNCLFLSGEDRANGFTIETEKHNNITLLRGSRQLAQFSRALSEEMVKVFVKLVRDYELRDEQLASNNYTR